MKRLQVRQVLLLIALTGLVISIWIIAQVWQTSLPIRELPAAKQRWADRPFSHYELVLKAYGQGRSAQCEQGYQVQNEQILSRFHDQCGDMLPDGTVTDLFDKIDGAIKDLAGIRIFPGSSQSVTGRWNQGDEIIHVTATYDPQLGYPHQVQIYVDNQNPWRYSDWWGRMFKQLGGSPELRETFDPSITYTVLSLRPLP